MSEIDRLQRIIKEHVQNYKRPNSRELAEQIYRDVLEGSLNATRDMHMRWLRAKEALCAVLADIADYERVNNLAPNPGRKFCWDSVANAYAILGLPLPPTNGANNEG